MELDIKELEEKPSDKIENFKEILLDIMPTLIEHTCSIGTKGGFLKRIQRGTWAGHIVEHIAIELQCLLGFDISFGKTYTTNKKGIYNVVFRYIDERVGIRAAEIAVEIVDLIYKGEMPDVLKYIKELEDIRDTMMFGPSTNAIINEATRRNIPHIRLNENSYVQLGHGKYQRRIEATLMDNTSAIGVDIAGDKERTKEILNENGIPVPHGSAVTNFNDALKLKDELGYPLVTKPLDGNHGRGITIDINNDEELKIGFLKAKEISNRVIVENCIKGFDFRVLLIDGKFRAAALREPAFVVGNGKDNISKLIENTNNDPKRGEGHEKILTKIKVDEETKRLLEVQNLSLDMVPKAGLKVYLKYTANLSSGGTAIDVTDEVHIENIRLMERIARLIDLNVMGIDVMAKTLKEPLKQGRDGIVEVNAGPGFRMHLSPSEGKSRDIGKYVVDMLFKEDAKYTVPICAVTGTNGKTTTTRLIAHILKTRGNIVGMTSTDAVVIDNEIVLKGDYSGPSGARAVLMDKTIDHAVLEVARGGILRRGLGFSSCDVGVLLNVTSDHLGFGGIDTLEDLARVKSTVTETVHRDGYAIFNADDDLVLSRVEKSKGRIILFSLDNESKALKDNLEKGNINVTLKDNNIIIQKFYGDIIIADVNKIPITFHGQAKFNIENVLAAVSATYALGVVEDEIKAGLLSFSPSIGQSPGRMNVIDVGGFKVVIDYGHNIGAIKATGEFIKNLMPGNKIRMASGVGNRRDEDIKGFGASLAEFYDKIVLCDSSPRIRKSLETLNLVKKGLLDSGFSKEDVKEYVTEKEATMATLNLAKPGDVIVLQAENIEEVTKDVLEFKMKLENTKLNHK